MASKGMRRRASTLHLSSSQFAAKMFADSKDQGSALNNRRSGCAKHHHFFECVVANRASSKIGILHALIQKSHQLAQDCIIVSLVRGSVSHNKSVGFLKDRRRMRLGASASFWLAEERGLHAGETEPVGAGP